MERTSKVCWMLHIGVLAPTAAARIPTSEDPPRSILAYCNGTAGDGAPCQAHGHWQALVQLHTRLQHHLPASIPLPLRRLLDVAGVMFPSTATATGAAATGAGAAMFASTTSRTDVAADQQRRHAGTTADCDPVSDPDSATSPASPPGAIKQRPRRSSASAVDRLVDTTVPTDPVPGGAGGPGRSRYQIGGEAVDLISATDPVPGGAGGLSEPRSRYQIGGEAVDLISATDPVPGGLSEPPSASTSGTAASRRAPPHSADNETRHDDTSLNSDEHSAPPAAAAPRATSGSVYAAAAARPIPARMLWHDVHVCVVGDAVQPLVTHFRQRWAAAFSGDPAAAAAATTTRAGKPYRDTDVPISDRWRSSVGKPYRDTDGSHGTSSVAPQHVVATPSSTSARQQPGPSQRLSILPFPLSLSTRRRRRARDDRRDDLMDPASCRYCSDHGPACALCAVPPTGSVDLPPDIVQSLRPQRPLVSVGGVCALRRLWPLAAPPQPAKDALLSVIARARRLLYMAVLAPSDTPPYQQARILCGGSSLLATERKARVPSQLHGASIRVFEW